MEQKQLVLEELLGNNSSDCSKFSIDWILNSRTTTEDMRSNYRFLNQIGLTNDKIASQAELLGLHPDTIQRNYEALQKLGLTNDKIASQAQLLGRDPDTIQRNYEALQKFFTAEKINTYAFLLGIKPKTVEDNITFLTNISIDYHIQPLLLGTNVKKKKDKLRQFFKIVFDEEVQEGNIEQRARKFYSDHTDVNTITKTLVRSTAYHQRNKETLRKIYNPAG
jgi:hypothetical protein